MRARGKESARGARDVADGREIERVAAGMERDIAATGTW